MADQLVVRSADPSLRPYVSGYWGYAQTAHAPGRQREPLSTGVVLIIGLGVPLGIADPREPERKASWFESFVAGLDDRCAVIEQAGEMRGVQVDLSPLAARMVLGESMGALAREVVTLDDVLGRDARVLEERLVNTCGWGERFDLVEAMLRRKLAAAEPPPPDVEWAWRRLLASHGRLQVSELTSELGCSRKHLAARFREHVGLPPKVYARMLRFRRATDLLSAGNSIAETAAECGYYDQPHFDRDFREFAGTTPSAYLAERVTFVQDAAAAGS